MIDPVLSKILTTAFAWGVCGSLIAAAGRALNRKKTGPRIDQVAAVGFLIGMAFGAFFGIFQSLLVRQ